ncbi:carbamoyltransferase C-terminal domain-containing protein [Nonomuraea sp. NPDC001684]
MKFGDRGEVSVVRILSLKPGHDGAVAYIRDGALEFSIEAEKDSFPRYASTTPSLFMQALKLLDNIPDVICLSGWVKGFHSTERPVGAGYYGCDEMAVDIEEANILGRSVPVFSSSHERSHLLSAYGMSPFTQGHPCYALVWEGNIGSFYEITSDVKVARIGRVLEDPGNKYQFIYSLADPTSRDEHGGFRFENAGELMALTAFAEDGPANREERDIIDFVLSRKSILLTTPKSELRWSCFHDIGVENQRFKNLSRKLSQEIYFTFERFARQHLDRGYPLLISGGCGLNCSWNTQWRNCGLFSEIFVPPCTNDTGSAIGTAVDAMFHFFGQAKIQWNVYAGSDFIDDVKPHNAYAQSQLDYHKVADLLARGKVMGWVQGRYELGPRALGNRSILAAPFSADTRDRLNAIKQREPYRPIAPICREEDVSRHFNWSGESPYMLYFQTVRDKRLVAVTHADGSARVQTVRRQQNPPIYDLLTAFERRCGVAVLCNTSLNFKGRGFINRMSDLVEYADDRGLDGFVVGDQLYSRRG